MLLNWQDRLDSASSRADVVKVARRFVAQFSAEEVEQLPGVCRPGKFLKAADVTAYAFLIVRHHGAGSSGTAALIHKLASFFSDASIRLSRSDLTLPGTIHADRRERSRRRNSEHGNTYGAHMRHPTGAPRAALP